MNRIVVKQRVGNDGTLQLNPPLGAEEAGRDVQVTVESVEPIIELAAEAWRAGILATAGRWQGEFERTSQGEVEDREPLS